MFGIGNAPTGSKDPFALRRAANAIVIILAESELPLTLRDVLHAPGTEPEQGIGPDDKFQPDTPVRAFLKERLHFYLKDVRGFAYDVVNAVLATGADDVCDAIARAEALTAVRGSEDFTAIVGAFKRIKNILRQTAEADEMSRLKSFVEVGSEENKTTLAISSLDANALIEAEEVALFQAYRTLAPVVGELGKAHNYAAALEQIATLRPVVDAFFDKVMVMAPDATLRMNRIALIKMVLLGFSDIADFSEVVVNITGFSITRTA